MAQKEPFFPEYRKPLVGKVEKTSKTNLPDQEKPPDFNQQEKEKERKRKEINETEEKGKIIDIKA